MARSTIYGVLHRHGMSRLAHTDRASGVVVRYQREHPGELVRLDVKKLGRIPDGGGHRIHGRGRAILDGLTQWRSSSRTSTGNTTSAAATRPPFREAD
jgi:hypothetical protein